MVLGQKILKISYEREIMKQKFRFMLVSMSLDAAAWVAAALIQKLR